MNEAETRAELIDPAMKAAGLYKRKRAALEALKNLLLHQAFAGEL